MSEAEDLYRAWCREAFDFLRPLGFTENPPGSSRNPFEVTFAKDGLRITVRGEGHGALASVFYVMPDGLEVGSEVLEPGWEPFPRQKKRRRPPKPSQREQIFKYAARIQDRDGDILGGNLSRLTARAEVLRRIKERLARKA